MIDMLARWRSETPHVGEYIPTEGNIIAHKGKKTIKLKVSNTGDRPIQVGSHTHFSEANKALEAPWLSGAVSRMGREVGIATPINDTLFAVLQPHVMGKLQTS